MPSLVMLGLNDIAIAYNFIADCADEEPREFGVNALPAYASRRDGVFQSLAYLDTEENLNRQASQFEDALISHLDGEDDEDDEDPQNQDNNPSLDEDPAPPAVSAASPVGWAQSARLDAPESRRLDLFEIFPEHHGMGRVIKRMPRAAKALRGGVTLRR